MALRLKNIRLRLDAFTLEVNAELGGRINVLFGASGAGKTSLLDLVAGLRRAESGCIKLDGETLVDTERGFFLPACARKIGYVPQDLALFPHLSVRHNLLYGRKSNETNPAFQLGRVAEILEIEALLSRDIGRLSGGEKQRVALGRALLSSPSLLLLDEPLASLDQQLKARILPYFLRIRDEFRLPMLYVTHDSAEARILADEILVLAEGKVVQQGAAREVFGQDTPPAA